MSDLAIPWTAAYQAPPSMGFSIHCAVVVKVKQVSKFPVRLNETQIVQQLLLRQLDIHMQKSEAGALFHIIYKKNQNK